MKLVKKTPDRFGLTVNINGKNHISHNADQSMPLASTVKIILAIAYIREVHRKKLDPNEQIPLNDLRKYYIQGTDGGAHEEWLSTQSVGKGSVSLDEVVIGMVKYSSNANTEYLLDRLGISNINQLIIDLDLPSHDPLFFLSPSANLVPHYLREQTNLSDDIIFKNMAEMSMDTYRDTTKIIHLQLKNENRIAPAENLNTSLSFQKLWSDRLPRASTSDYAKIMATINRGTNFTEGEKIHLQSLLEMNHHMDQIRTMGGKGGSTAFVLTIALYVEDIKGNLIEFVFFSDQKDVLRAKLVELSYKKLIKQLIVNSSFRDKISAYLKQL
ncbi:serine hydrolase [Hazenella sp. IB182357]|uniref:Serine hydrolase n=1 Tax=Polycladospora coralii TaxID=2771432 RepID=A0A926RT65_9BACL|nr:serine hydrolase [Polycladospora coralii]MBD1370937.1 serine hydrolase [Polycladospora coralii]MBS7529876.1 serine hydrolase [Polycladospora coralii]